MIIAVVFIFILGITGIVITILSMNPKQRLTVELPSNSEISIYKVVNNEQPFEFRDQNRVATSKTGFEQELKKGSYSYKVTPSTMDYEAVTGLFDINDESVDISPKLSISATKLTQIAAEQQPTITTQLTSTFSYAINKYKIEKITAFGDGTWIGARLSPLDTSSDTYLALFKLKDGKLELVTNPPTIVIAKPVYPNVPGEVIASVNKLSDN